LAFVLVPLTAQAGQWVGTSGEVKYVLIHKLHVVEGKSVKTEAIAVLDDAGLKVMARAPVASFDSGNGNRDAHMLEVVDGQTFPLVVFKGVAPGFRLPVAPGRVTVHVQGEVDLHGAKVQRPVDIELEVKDATHILAHFAFDESLTAHKIERPSLLMIPVDDALKISGDLTLELKP
jgi:hypothetical protein